MTELHIAITLDEPSVVRSILSQQLVDIHTIDNRGDQPAHLAARLNRIECIKVLIEYGAKIGRKNFNNLTPLGEAQMNGHREITALIKDNYTWDETHQYIWDEEIRRECAAWYDSWDETRQVLQWVRVGPDGEMEVSHTPPPMDVQRVIEAREKYGERNVVRVLHPGSLPSQQQLEFDRQKKQEEMALAAMLKSRAAIVEERCATRLQAHFRKIQAAKIARRRSMERVAANRIQKRYVVKIIVECSSCDFSPNHNALNFTCLLGGFESISVAREFELRSKFNPLEGCTALNTTINRYFMNDCGGTEHLESWP